MAEFVDLVGLGDDLVVGDGLGVVVVGGEAQLSDACIESCELGVEEVF
mgnify:CR=1 FL=1